MKKLLTTAAVLAILATAACGEQPATFAERFGDWIETDGRNADPWLPRNAAVLYLDGPRVGAVQQDQHVRDYREYQRQQAEVVPLPRPRPAEAPGVPVVQAPAVNREK
jgi:hypothetical protein